MKIETKFNIGQEVFFLTGTKLESDKVHSIKVESNGKTTVDYYFRKEVDGQPEWKIISESMVFASREEFVNQLTTKP